MSREETMPDAEAVEPSSAKQIGETLRIAREKHSLSHEYIEAQLKISLDKIEFIEKGEFDLVGRATFVRGYISRYCRLVNLDPSEVLEKFEMVDSDASSSHGMLLRERVTLAERIKERSGLLLSVIAALAVLIVLGTLFTVWTPPGAEQTQQPVDEGQEAQATSTDPASIDPVQVQRIVLKAQQPTPPKTVDAGNIADDSGFEAVPESQNVTPSDAWVDAEVSTSTDGADEGIAAPEPGGERNDGETIVALEEEFAGADELNEIEEPVPVAPVLERVGLSFSGRCHATVIDGTGKTLYIGTARAGDKLSLWGLAPFEIELGRSALAKLSFRGQDVPLQPHTTIQSAKLTIGQ